MGADTRSRLTDYAHDNPELTRAQARRLRVLGSRMSPPETLTA